VGPEGAPFARVAVAVRDAPADTTGAAGGRGTVVAIRVGLALAGAIAWRPGQAGGRLAMRAGACPRVARVPDRPRLAGLS
jgi:hypothetical protein